MERKYTATDLIIQVQLTPGGPGSQDYDLHIMGDGQYIFARYYAVPNPKKIAEKDIQAILEQAERINFKQFTVPTLKALPFVNDGQQTNVSIWIEGYLRKGTFGYGNPMPTEVRTLVNTILTLTDGPNHAINH